MKDQKDKYIEYDDTTAFHYAAYRPSLHSEILLDCFANNEFFELGLDVGSGTGQSSIALAKYCHQVIGIEPSQDMLDKALTHKQVKYLRSNGKLFDFKDNTFDVITFAGSLYYAKPAAIINETIRVSKNGARIIVYDFEILLDEILNQITGQSFVSEQSEYNHEEDFSGLAQQNFVLIKQSKSSTEMDISSSDISHLLLSSKERLNHLRSERKTENLYDDVKEKIHSKFGEGLMSVRAKVYLSFYKVEK